MPRRINKPPQAVIDQYRADLIARRVTREQMAASLGISEGSTYKLVPTLGALKAKRRGNSVCMRGVTKMERENIQAKQARSAVIRETEQQKRDRLKAEIAAALNR